MNLFATSLCALLQSIAITGGTVHPMDGSKAFVGDVLIDAGVITAVGVDLTPSESATIIDASGLHVVPGLIDGMMHHDGDHDDLYVQAGVVLARDMGNDLGRILFSKARSYRAGARGPKLFISGAVLDGAPPITTKAAIVRSEAESQAKVGRLVELEVDFIATHGRVTGPALKGATQAAHNAGKKVWGPVPLGLSLEQVTVHGLDGIVGLDSFLEDPYGWISPDEPEFDAGVQVALGGGLAIMPVVNSVAARVRIPESPELTLSYFSPHYGAQWTAELDSRAKLGAEGYYRTGNLALSRQERLVAQLFGAGVQLVPGSGAPNPWVLPGDGLHDEFQSWVRAGIPPIDVLRMATSGAAKALGLSESVGQLRPNFSGDGLVVDGDPRESISSLRRPAWVILRGEALKRELLAERVEELRQRQIASKLAAQSPLEIEPPTAPEGRVLLSGLVESTSLGQRIASERYLIVELPEEAGTASCSRMIAPASATQGSSEIEFKQVISKRRVVSFSLEVRSQGSSLAVKGQRVGGQLRIERRVDGVFFDNNSSSESVSVVDSGSVVALMAIAHNRGPGDFKAIYFEDLDPISADWTYQIKDNGIHTFTTGEGPMVALFDENGAVDKMERTRGNGVMRHASLEVELHGGAGVNLYEGSNELRRESAPDQDPEEEAEDQADKE